MAFKVRTLSLNLPFGLGGMEVQVSEVQQRAAWELYVELATRITAAPMDAEVGSIREALDSLYSVFGTTRSVLRQAGPDVADGPHSLGPIAIRILNEGLRPFVSTWHTALLTAAADEERWHEFSWDRRSQFYEELEATRAGLSEFIDELARMAGITDER